MIVVHRVDLLAQLFQFELRLGFAVRRVEEIPQLSDDASEALYKTLHPLLPGLPWPAFPSTPEKLPGFLRRPQRTFHSCLAIAMRCSSFFGTARLDLPAVGEQRDF